MLTVRDIIAMCKQGKIIEAYDLAKSDYANMPQDSWTQVGFAWSIYFLLKANIKEQNGTNVFPLLDELYGLDLLSTDNAAMLYDSVLWIIAEYVKKTHDEKVLDSILLSISRFTFKPSKGYSYLLKVVMGFDKWNHLLDFFEWWNLENLMPEDYQPFEMNNGKKIMSLAEQAYINCSKALLKLNNREMIREFLPQIEKLTDNYPDMTYPGYYCGKLMLATGSGKEDALDAIMPFVRKKQSEFWVWQLLSEINKEEPETQLACLLYASHCKAKEFFLRRIRVKLISILLSKMDFPRAKYHLEKVLDNSKQENINPPIEVQEWLKESWVQNTSADKTDSIDYQTICRKILTRGANESIAIVTYANNEKKNARIVYGERKETMIRTSAMHFKVGKGVLLKVYWLPAEKEDIVVSVEEIKPSKLLLENIPYIKVINGVIEKKDSKPFAFIKGERIKCFITPNDVAKNSIRGNEVATVVATLTFNEKKGDWTWVCVSLKKG